MCSEAREHEGRRAGGVAPSHRAQLAPERFATSKKEVPTFDEWLTGRFWREWVVGRRNKPTEVKSKQYIYDLHLKPAFGELRLDEIGAGEIAEFRATLVERKLGEKRINNILAVLSKPLKYAVDVELISNSPKIGLYKVERPEIEPWDFEQYARMLAAAKVEGPDWYAAVCLAGEAGLRSGEVKALRWREDVDLIARTITVNQQTCYGITTTPKGRTRRTIPMTSALELALKRLEVVREGFVGQAETDPDRRVLGMLGARGKNVAKTPGQETKKAAEAAL
jgi:integrase